MNFTKSKNRPDSIRIIDVKKAMTLTIAMIGLSLFSLNAQSTPESPETPKTTKGTSYSISINNDDDKSSNSSVSISKTDDTYKFRANYHNSKNEGVKAIVLKSLGKTNLNIKGNTYLWTDSKNGDEVFECKLTKGHLRMSLDTNLVSHEFSEKIKSLGNELKYYISGTDKNKENAKNAERAKKDLERAERDLERAKRDLERAERDAKRTKQN